MSVKSNKANLMQAIKKLKADRQRIIQSWNDPISVRFAAKYLDPLDEHLRVAVAAIEQLDEVLMKIQRDCD